MEIMVKSPGKCHAALQNMLNSLLQARTFIWSCRRIIHQKYWTHNGMYVGETWPNHCMAVQTWSTENCKTIWWNREVWYFELHTLQKTYSVPINWIFTLCQQQTFDHNNVSRDCYMFHVSHWNSHYSSTFPSHRFLPRVVGCIDCAHIEILLTEEKPYADAYRNYKTWYSIHLQVCTNGSSLPLHVPLNSWAAMTKWIPMHTTLIHANLLFTQGTCTYDLRWIHVDVGFPGMYMSHTSDRQQDYRHTRDIPHYTLTTSSVHKPDDLS